MAVKQKNVDCVDPSSEARLTIILRTLQDISRGGLHQNICAQIVVTLGTIQVPTESTTAFLKFIENIKGIQTILKKECSGQDLLFVALKAFYDEISNPKRTPSPAMSIVLQLIDIEAIPGAVKYILNAGYPEQNLERALYTLCHWLTRWTYTENLGPLVLAFMHGLEQEHHYDMLVDVTISTIKPLFKLLVLPQSRRYIGPLVLNMLSHVHHNPEPFHKVVPHIEKVVKSLHKENTESSLYYLQQIVNLSSALMEHFDGYPTLYQPLKETLASYRLANNYKASLENTSWTDGTGCPIPSRCSIGKVGLYNLGNTCYMNSILQALFMTKTFRNEMLLHNKSMLPLFSKLQVLFMLLQCSKRNCLSPNDILMLLRPPGFSLGHQHDSSEFLGYLLDTLHEQEKNVSKSIGDEACAFESIPTTVVQQAFGGKSVTVSCCAECGTKSERTDSFRDLQLSFPNVSDNQSVQSLLDYYLQPEKMCGDNQYHCDMCQRLTDGERITKILDTPPRLILTLKHFRYDASTHQRIKLLQRVNLDEQIDIDGVKFDMYAAVVHCGSSVDSGHYYTFAKDDSDWYKFNDSSVIKTNLDELCRLKPPETPYILFYSKRDYSEPDTLPSTLLSADLQLALTRDNSEFESERKRIPLKVYGGGRINRGNDEPPPPPPPGPCGGGGFGGTATGNMFIC